MKILLLHGALGSPQDFHQFGNILSEWAEVHTFEFEGHGTNTEFKDKYIFDSYLTQLESWLVHHGKAHVFGYSMGGYVALSLASSKPYLFESLFTFAVKMTWNKETIEKETRGLNADFLKERNPNYYQHLALVHRQPERLLTYVVQMMYELAEHQPLNNENLREIEIPVLLSVGDRDKMVTLEETIHAYRQISGCCLQVFPNTEHRFEKINIGMLASSWKTFLES